MYCTLISLVEPCLYSVLHVHFNFLCCYLVLSTTLQAVLWSHTCTSCTVPNMHTRVWLAIIVFVCAGGIGSYGKVFDIQGWGNESKVSARLVAGALLLRLFWFNVLCTLTSTSGVWWRWNGKLARRRTSTESAIRGRSVSVCTYCTQHIRGRSVSVCTYCTQCMHVHMSECRSLLT